MPDANGFEVARAYVTIVPTMQGAQKTIAAELTGVSESAATEAGDKSGKKLGEGIAKGLKATAATIGAALTTATAAAVGTGKAFLNAANSTAQYGDSIDKMSQKMGVSATFFQEFDFVAKHAGTSMESLKGSMKTLANAAVNGSDAFNKLGISQEQIASMSQEELFAATIKALQNVGNETERTALASKVLGKGATELGALLNMSADETDALRQQVHDLGGVMSDEAIQASAQYQDEMQNLDVALTGVKNNMMSQFLPGISSVMSGLSKVFSGQGGIDEIKTGLQSVITNITTMAPQFFELASVLINSLLSGFAPMIPSLVSSIFGFLQTGLLTLVDLIPQLTPVITEGVKGLASALLTCLPVLINALIDMAKELVTWLASGDNVKTFVDGILELVSVISQGLADALPILLPAIVNIIGQIAASLTDPKNVTMIIKSVLYTIGALAVAIVKAIPQLLQAAGRVLSNIGATVKQWGGQLVGRIGPWLASVWSGIASWFTQLPGKLANAFKTGKDTILGWGKSAITWGSDMIKNFINGIKKKASDLGKAVKDLAKNCISKFLHFSVPDAGPLADADKWMPDFVDLMATGLENSAPQMQAAVEDFAGGMSANISAYGPTGALGNMTNYNGGAVTINVYGAQGQNVDELAQKIAYKLESMTARKGAVYA